MISNANFGKTMENVRKNTDIKLVTTGRNYLMSEPNYQFFHGNFLGARNENKNRFAYE